MEADSEFAGVFTSTPKDTSTLAMTLNRSRRKTLQSIQPSVTGNKLNGGKDGVLKIYGDLGVPETSLKSRCCRLTQTDDSLLDDLLQERLHDTNDSGRISGYLEKEAFDLMVREEVSETYWKELAEERRRALNETLVENEKLSSRIELLVEENKQLQEKNDRLNEIVVKAEAIQELLGSMVSDDDEDTSLGVE